MSKFAVIIGCVLFCTGSLHALNAQLRVEPGEGKRLIFLEDAVRFYDWTVCYHAGRVELAGRRHAIELESGSRVMLVDRVRMDLQEPVLRRMDGRWVISEADLHRRVVPFLREHFVFRTAVRSVVIDAGHGGSDFGAVRDGVQEKTVNLLLAERLMRILKEEGLKVSLTRTGDEKRTLDQRADEVRVENADILISIHQNAAPNLQATGMEAYYAPGTRFEEASMELAHAVLQHALKVFGEDARKFDRGVRQAGFRVIRRADCPAVLLECGFVSNAGDRQRMQDEAWLDAQAEAIADGILAYTESAGSGTAGGDR